MQVYEASLLGSTMVKLRWEISRIQTIYEFVLNNILDPVQATLSLFSSRGSSLQCETVSAAVKFLSIYEDSFVIGHTKSAKVRSDIVYFLESQFIQNSCGSLHTTACVLGALIDCEDV